MKRNEIYFGNVKTQEITTSNGKHR